MQYIGEHLLPGQIGQAFLVLGFVSSLLGAVAYYFATQRRALPEFHSWKKIGRISFIVHGISVFGVIGILFYIMLSQYFEYQYVWAHVSEDLPFKYIFSAFWEGQEGSFLLWMFWHVVLGIALIFVSGKWESPVMSILSMVQLFIGSMLLGLYVGFGDDPLKIGSSPLLLLRETMDAPIFDNADYLSLISGSGLNPLLQNYWMTIHPPTLFLGFAASTIPFCYAIAGLWTKQHKEWLKPALKWSLFNAFTLGTGILMGGAWAYEALSFGGYWAWDPVENMSLVPWLVLIAGIHTNLVAKSTAYSIRSTYIFYTLAFLLVLYSTFLTRSGVLGETSVHAFTEMGLEWQLLLFLGFFFFLSIFLIGRNYKTIPSHKKEESIASREFWMFIGSLVLLFSAILITSSTSLPIYNKIRQFFDPVFEGKVITDPIPHYNKYQIWIGVFIGLLSGISQFMRYKEKNWNKQFKRFSIHIGSSLLITALLSWPFLKWIEIHAWQYVVLLFFGLFAFVTNSDFLISFIKGNLKFAGSAISHLGFGIMIVGILASGLNKKIISSNPLSKMGLIEEAGQGDILHNTLLIKDSPMSMSGYEVTYTHDTLENVTRTFEVNFKRKSEDGNVVEDFNLYPNILYEKDFSKISASNPSTKHYWNKDVFTHIKSLSKEEMDPTFAKEIEDSLNYRFLQILPGESLSFNDTLGFSADSSHIKSYKVELLSISRNPVHPEYEAEANDLPFGVKLAIQEMGSEKRYFAEPVLVLRGQHIFSYPVQINDAGIKVKLSDEVFKQYFAAENQLSYQEFILKQGEKFHFEGHEITFSAFNRNPDHPGYQAEKGDIVVSAVMKIQEGGKNYTAQPVYLIRDSHLFIIKDEIPELFLHFRFLHLNPQEETLQLQIAKKAPEDPRIPLSIATNSARSDYIVLEVIEFPGINMFWLGSTLLLLGFLLAFWRRGQEKNT